MQVPPSSVAGLRVPEDIARLIISEILRDGDRQTFHTAALISPSFLYVAQGHLYKSYTLNLRDPFAICNIFTLLYILHRQSYIQTFIDEFKITDHYPTEFIPRHQSSTSKDYDTHYSIPTSVMQDPIGRRLPSYIEIFIQNSLDYLPRLLSKLTCLSKTSLVFSHRHLDWEDVHPQVQLHIQQFLTPRHPNAATQVVGVDNLPLPIAASLIRHNSVKLDKCHFKTRPLPYSFRQPPVSQTGRLESLSLTSSSLGGIAGVVGGWVGGALEPPPVRILEISIPSLDSVHQATVILSTFGTDIEELMLSTATMELSHLLIQPPPNPTTCPSAYFSRLPRVYPHDLGDCFAQEADAMGDDLHPAVDDQLPGGGTNGQPPLVDKDGWFVKVLEKLQPRHYPHAFVKLRKLRFEVSHWGGARGSEANGELLWVALWLADVAVEVARNIEELSIDITAGADCCLENANAVQELAEYHGWTLWDTVLNHEKWGGLKQVKIMVKAKTTCIFGVEMRLEALMGLVQRMGLPRLNARGILDMGYIPVGAAETSS